MAAAVEVIGQTQGEVMAELLLEAQIGLLGVRVYEVLGLGIAEGLERQRKESCRAQIVLINEQTGVRGGGRREWRGIKSLAAGLIARNRGQARGQSQNALKNISRVQARSARMRGILITRTSPGKQQLPAFGTIRGIAQEIEAEQRMVVKNPVRGANDRFAVAPWIPSHTNARLNIVGVSLYSFLDAQRVVSCKRQGIWGSELGNKFHIVANAVVEREVMPNSPGIQ